MLDGIKSMLQRASTLNLNDAWQYAVLNNYHISNKIKEWIIEQLEDGVNEDGQIIGTYSFATEIITNGRKRAGEPYDLNDTGFFRGSIIIVPSTVQINVYANGQKQNENILDKYSLKVIGLIEENKEKLKEIILTEFLKYAQNTLYQS
jgi:hypothetical protein